MDFDDSVKRYSPYLRQYFFPLILGLLGLMFLGYGLIGYFARRDKPDILFEAASDVSSVAETEEGYMKKKSSEDIAVDVEGAVQRPGVYQLKAGSRIEDALIAAGGLSSTADRGLIAKKLNLAAKLSDGMKVYFPYLGDEVVISNSVTSSGGEQLVNINSASSQELDGLPGIGQITAEKIINNRPYDSIKALVEKKIVGQKVFEQIEDRIVAQ